MADEKFRLPDSSYDELTRIIKAYSAFEQPTSPGPVAKVLGKDATQVSRNNPFLKSVGLLEGTQKKQLSALGVTLARALEYEMPDEITRGWRGVVDSDDFFQRLISAIRIRKGMDISTLRGHVAYSAGQPRSPRVMAGAGAVIDILRAAGAVREHEGRVVAVDVTDDYRPHPVVAELGVSMSDSLRVGVIPRTGSSPVASEPSPRASVVVEIHVTVACTPDDLEDLGQKLRRVLDDIAAQSER